MEHRPRTRKEIFAWLVLLLSLMLPGQARAAFLIQGAWAVFGEHLAGFPAMGIESATGKEAAKVD